MDTDTDKKPFSSMGRTILAFGCAVLILAVAGAGIALAVGGGKNRLIDRNEAMEYALADAGLEFSDVVLVRQNLVKEENHYEISFSDDSHKYDYEIDAFTGKVTGVSIEALLGQAAESGENSGTAGGRQGAGNGEAGNREPSGDSSGNGEAGNREPSGDGTGNGEAGSQEPSGDDAGNGEAGSREPSGAGQGGDRNQAANREGAGGETPQGASGEEANGGQMDLESARKAALEDAGVDETAVTFKKAELDWDGGIQVYDIEFYTDAAEYDYKIDCASGMVLDRKVEWFPGQTQEGSGGNMDSYISLDEARRIAAEHAGYSVDEVVFTESEMETEHGRTEYEIDFFHGRMEYEYTIDAVTGKILEFDSEYED